MLEFFLLCYWYWCKMACPSVEFYFPDPLSWLSWFPQSEVHPPPPRSKLTWAHWNCHTSKPGAAASRDSSAVFVTCWVCVCVFEETLSWHQWHSLISSVNHPRHKRPSVLRSFNEVFKPSIHQYFLMHYAGCADSDGIFKFTVISKVK